MKIKYMVLLVSFFLVQQNGLAVQPTKIKSKTQTLAVQHSTKKANQSSSSVQHKKKMKKKQRKKRKFAFTLGRLSLGLGVLGAILIWQPYVSILGLLCGIAAVVLGVFALKKEQHKKMAKWGIILGSLGIAYFLTIFALILFL